MKPYHHYYLKILRDSKNLEFRANDHWRPHARFLENSAAWNEYDFIILINFISFKFIHNLALLIELAVNQPLIIKLAQIRLA